MNLCYSFQVKMGAERAFRYLPQKETKKVGAIAMPWITNFNKKGKQMEQ